MGLRNKNKYNYTTHFLTQVSKRYPKYKREELIQYLEELKDTVVFCGISKHPTTRNDIHIYRNERDTLLVDPKKLKLITMFPYSLVKQLDDKEVDVEEEVRRELEVDDLTNVEVWNSVTEDDVNKEDFNTVVDKEKLGILEARVYDNLIPKTIQERIFDELLEIARERLQEQSMSIVLDNVDFIKNKKESLNDFDYLEKTVKELLEQYECTVARLKEELELYSNILEHSKINSKLLRKELISKQYE